MRQALAGVQRANEQAAAAQLEADLLITEGLLLVFAKIADEVYVGSIGRRTAVVKAKV